ncbi:alpha/beta hydrolase [Streptomyces capparidis]
MDTLESHTLAVPGARLHYEVRGAGPLLLLIPGGSCDAAVFTALAAVLARDHRVLTYDPRGISRSPLDGPPGEQRVEVNADDARRLLDHVAADGERALVLGNCSGAQAALHLAARHPGRVRAVVAHEPPAVRLLPDAEEQTAFLDEVHRTFHRAGLAAGLLALNPFFGGRPAPKLPAAGENSAYFLDHVLRPSTRFVPDVPALAALGDRVVVAGGLDSRADAVHRPAAALARLLGREPELFPGGHVGFVDHPAGFAARLAEVFAAVPAAARGAGPGGGVSACGS